jgi:tetratricopeptide (TPR) repeat protein
MAEETQTLEQTLEKTDLGHFVNTNKNGIIIAGAIIMALIAGFSIYKHNADKTDQEALKAVYQFEKTNVTPFLEGKNKDIKADDVIAKLEAAPMEIMKNANFLPAVFGVVNKLKESGDATKAIGLLEKIQKNYRPKEFAYFFVAVKLAVLYEDAGKADEAIATLESLVSANHEVMKSKVYLDLGRLYKKKGLTDKARANFDYIVKNDGNSDYGKLARLYLMQLK